MEPVYKNLGKVRPTIDNNNWSIDNKYDLLTIVYDPSSNKSYISRKDVPANVVIDNREYWLPFGVGRFVDNAIININYLDGVSQELVTYTLEEAIARIGDEDKRLGVIISFYGNEASDSHTPGWCLYQFMSDDLNDWDNVDAWNSIYYNRNKNVGWFRTESELLAIYPSPHKGDYCYIGVSLISSLVYRCYENGTWVNTHELASANIGITIGGNIRISENGTWVVDDEDTGIKAVGTGIDKMTYTPSQEDGGTNVLQVKLTDGTQFSFPIKNGHQGNSGIIVPDLETFLAELVNDLTTNDATKALSAAQGVVLDNKISQLGQFYAHTNDSRLVPIIREIYIDESIVSGFDYFYLNIYPSINVFRIVGVASGIETIIFQSSFPANANSIVELETGQEWPESGVLFGYAIIDATGQMPSSDIGGVRLYNTGLWDNPAIKSYIDNQGLESNFNAKVFDLSARISHVNDNDVKLIIKEIYIDTSIVGGFDRYTFNWYKNLGLFRVTGMNGSTETVLTQDRWTPNVNTLIPLAYNGQNYGYLILDTTHESNDKFGLQLFNYSIYENPVIYAYINDQSIYKRIVHTNDVELNAIIKEIYIDSSAISAFDSISVNWYSSLHLIRIIATKNGVSEILSQPEWTSDKYEILPLITDSNYHEEGIHYGYIVLDNTKTCPDKSDVPIFRYELYDNPIIYSYYLGVTGSKINYITATRNTDNFNSIRGIINAITDATEDNQYVIIVPKGEWFECDLNGKNYVKIVGESRDETILYCDGTSTKLTPSNYSILAYQNIPLNEVPEIYKHCVMQRANLDFDNLTIRVNDAKYCIHVGASDLGGSYNKLSVKNCKLIALEHTNCPVGIGADNYTAIFENCIFQDNKEQAIGIHCHNHSNSSKPLHLDIIDCLFDGCNFINAGELGSGQDDYYNIINCYSTVCGSIYYYVDSGFTWINPTTHEQETNPQNVPYCIKINALGSNVTAIIDRPINGADSRPDAQKYILTDHYIILPSTGLSLGDIVKGYLDLKNVIHISANGKVLGVVEKIIDGMAYIAKGRVILRVSQLTAGSEGDLAYMDANKKITNVVSGDPIGLFDTTLMWGEYQAVILF